MFLLEFLLNTNTFLAMEFFKDHIHFVSIET